MKYLSTTETAKKWGISVQRVRVLCQEDRILGVTRVGKSYMIPADAIKPADFRRSESIVVEQTHVLPNQEMMEQRLYDFIPVGLAIYKKCGNAITMVRMNKYLRELIGLNGDELLNRPVSELMEYIHPEDIETLLAALVNCFQKKEEQNMHFRIWDSCTGQYRTLHTHAEYGTNVNGNQYVFANFTDQTELKNLQEELKKCQKQIKEAKRHTLVQYVEYDVEKKLAFLEKDTASDYGLPSVMDDFPAQACRPDIIYPEDFKIYKEKFNEVLHGHTKETIFRARIKLNSENKYIWRKIIFSSTFNEKGILIQVNGMSIPMPEEK